MSGYVYVDVDNQDEANWTLEIKSYSGSVTAEEFAVQHGLIAVNDNAVDEEDMVYAFVGQRSKVLKAFDAYLSNVEEQ